MEKCTQLLLIKLIWQSQKLPIIKPLLPGSNCKKFARSFVYIEPKLIFTKLLNEAL
jgi:hypothetical protein